MIRAITSFKGSLVFTALTLAGAAFLRMTAIDAATPRQAAPPSTAAVVAPVATAQRAFLDQYCVGCHNDRLRTAGLSLQTIDMRRVTNANAEVWEKVVAKLRSGAMPPAGARRPEKAAADDVITWVETQLDQAAASTPNPGQTPPHRLNRAEYVNAIRDLLALEIDGRSLLPADDASYGFDNIADVLTVSPGLLDRYLIAAQKISRLAIGDPTIRSDGASYKRVRTFRQDLRVSEESPFGTRGGIVVRHYFPVDGEYSLKALLQRVVQGSVRGVNEENILELRLNGDEIAQFTIFCNPRRPDIRYDANNEDVCSLTADAHLEARVAVKAGTHVVAAAFLTNPWLKEGLEPDRYPLGSHSYGNNNGAQMALESLDIQGPFNTTGPGASASRQQIFICRPNGRQDERSCATKILSTLARRAYRRPVNDADLQTLLTFYDRGRASGGFETGIQLALERLLIDPEFLVRTERQPVGLRRGTPYRITDLELASRLSFFLWSSIPDEELVAVAARGQLRVPAVLRQQVLRMLGDPKARALVTNFGGQWLFLRNLREVAPDNKEYPDFDDSLREAMQQETELFLEDQLRGDRSVVDLLRANYTFINQRLAEHYGIPNVYGSHFRRITYPDDRRAGILGQAGVLVATNVYPNRTSPVKRGVWLLDNILGAPPPAPPPNVPPLPEEEGAATKTVRERLEKHRTNPTCATCHARIDPLGYAMENFDAVGQWRDTDAGVPIDVTGQLPDGSKFNGPKELRQLILSRKDEFLATFTKKLLTYAVGRGVEYHDMPAVRTILRGAAPTDYQWSSIIFGIVNSAPFQMRRAS